MSTHLFIIEILHYGISHMWRSVEIVLCRAKLKSKQLGVSSNQLYQHVVVSPTQSAGGLYDQEICWNIDVISPTISMVFLKWLAP